MGGLSVIGGGKEDARVLYMAERKRPEKYSYFAKGDAESGRNEFEVKETWGEQMDEVTSTVPCILNCKTGQVTVLDFLNPEISFFNPVWVSETVIAVIGYTPKPVKLGVIYCNNRESEVFVVDISNKTVDTVSKNVKTSLFPKVRQKSAAFSAIFVTPDSRSVITLANEPLGAHMQFKTFVKIDLNTSEVKELGSFSVESIPQHAWINLQTFCFNVFEKATITPMVLNIQTGEAQKLINSECETNQNSYKALDICAVTENVSESEETKGQKSCNTYVLLGNSSFVFPEKLVLYNMADATLTKDVSYSLNDGDFFVKKNEFESNGFYRVGPKDQNTPRPCILFNHGGPHVLFSDYFTLGAAFFAEMGFNVVMVNYIGSLGYSPDALESLAGHVGSKDVQDCYDMLQLALKDTDWNCDPSKVAVTGGSHGGFLSLHLIGQYPGFFKACSVRNPVTNIGSMIGVTDIPDWTVYESTGTDYSFDNIGDPKFYETSWSKSPISYTSKVVTPTQIHLGLKDKRVPISQGREYHKALKGFAKTETVLFEYPEDNHPLSSPKALSNFYIETYKWFVKHLEL